LPDRVLDVLPLAPVEGLLPTSPLGGSTETGMARIGISPSKLGMGEMKLSRICIQTIKA
jgi:hypothetical protein